MSRSISDIPSPFTRLATAIILCFILLISFASSIMAVDLSRWAARPGTIPWMQNQPIGSQVTLDAVMVSEIGSGYLVVNEMFDSSQKVRVQAYARVNWRQCVEVTGTLAQSGGEKYLANAQVYEYIDIAGNLLPIVPKGIDPNLTWPYKKNVTLSPGEIPVSKITPALTTTALAASTTANTVAPLAAIKQLSDGTRVDVCNKWVTSSMIGMDIYGHSLAAAWIEEADRSAGIKVVWDETEIGNESVSPLDRGKLASFSATIATEPTTTDMDSATTGTESGQKVLHLLSSDTVSYIEPDYGISAVQIPPFAMSNRSIGGPEISQPQFYGVANTGLLISTWGKIVGYAYTPDFAALQIDDGSQVPLRIDVIDPVYLNTSGYARITGVSDTIARTELCDGLQGIPVNTPVRRVVAYISDVRDCSDAAVSSMPTGSISGNIYANVKPAPPTRIYTAYGSTTIGQDDWQYNGSRYSCPYTLSGVPGRKLGSSFDPTYAVIVTAKSPGFGSVSKFAVPGSTGIDFDLADTSVLRLDLSSSSSSPLGCGESATISAHLYDSEGVPLPGQQITFTATNGEFSPGARQIIVDADSDGRCSVNVNPTGEGDIILTAQSLGAQNRQMLRVKREMLLVWSDPALDDPSGTATVYAKLMQPDGVTPAAGETIAFAPSGGYVEDPTKTTNSQGIAQTIFHRTIGDPSVMASYTNGCGWTVRFNQGNPDSILASQELSLSQFNTRAAFIEWLNIIYTPSGGDSPELQLDALHYAVQNINTYSTSSCRYIVLITDDVYHYYGDNSAYPYCSQVTVNQVIFELTGTSCPVYISLWNDAYHSNYTQLIVNGGEFDPANSFGTDQNGNWKYPMANLRARILADQ